MLLLYDAVVTAVVVVLLLDLRFGRWVDATVADLVIGLGGGRRRVCRPNCDGRWATPL